MTENEYREKFQLYMLRASMEPDEEKRKEISKLIKNLEKKHEQLRFTNTNSAIDEMFAETDVMPKSMDSESIFTMEEAGGKVK